MDRLRRATRARPCKRVDVVDDRQGIIRRDELVVVNIEPIFRVLPWIRADLVCVSGTLCAVST